MVPEMVTLKLVKRDPKEIVVQQLTLNRMEFRKKMWDFITERSKTETKWRVYAGVPGSNSVWYLPFVKTFFPELPSDLKEHYFHPSLAVQLVGHWACVSWTEEKDPKPTSDEESWNLEEDFVFAKLDDAGKYQEVPFPSSLRISFDSDFVGDGLLFPSFSPPWPWVIEDPEAYDDIGRLNKLLDPEDENPLTLLLRTAKKPYKEWLKQVVAELQEIRRLLEYYLAQEFLKEANKR